MQGTKGKQGSLLFKIDLEKVYDRVDQGFLRLALTKFGFPSIIVELIMNCVSTSSLSFLWNDGWLKIFTPTRGLHKGDSLSSYLFVLYMEKLSLLISKKVPKGAQQLAKVARVISHLFFLDDCLLFIKAKAAQVQLLNKVLQLFCEASRLKVNLEK